MAQRQVVVIVGLEWMAARGHIRILDDTEESFTIGKPEGEASERDAQRKIEELRGLLNETRAYRAYFKRADTQILLNKGK
jgi:hypothetical protein